MNELAVAGSAHGVVGVWRNPYEIAGPEGELLAVDTSFAFAIREQDDEVVEQTPSSHTPVLTEVVTRLSD